MTNARHLFVGVVLALALVGCAPLHRVVARPLGAKSSCPTVGESVLDSLAVVGLTGASLLAVSAHNNVRGGATLGLGISLAVGDVFAEVTCDK
jgi:hypothetical protein